MRFGKIFLSVLIVSFVVFVLPPCVVHQAMADMPMNHTMNAGNMDHKPCCELNQAVRESAALFAETFMRYPDLKSFTADNFSLKFDVADIFVSQAKNIPKVFANVSPPSRALLMNFRC